jgi:hypothetical protein
MIIRFDGKTVVVELEGNGFELVWGFSCQAVETAAGAWA